jgi:hypothetical protein
VTSPNKPASKEFPVPADYNERLFGPIERFVEIEICGKKYQVPDKLELLRVFQYLDYHIDYSRLCWNGSCQKCFISFDKDGKSQPALCCRKKSFPDMNVTKLPATIKPTK